MAFKKYFFSNRPILGFDNSVFYTTLSRGIQAFGGLANLFFISIYLTPQEQGYFYTFGSLIAIQIFFELGLNSIIVQFVSHEFAHLVYDEKSNSFEGESIYSSRIADIFRLIKKYFLFLACSLFLVLLICGIFFFNKYGKYTDINWFYPWVALCASTSFFFYLNPFIGFFQGLGQITEISKLYFVQQIILIPMVFFSFYFGMGIWSLVISNFCSVLVFSYFLLTGNRLKILSSLSKINISHHVNYLKEIFPFQWRIALSWISGYFIFQFFNPVLFAFEGAEIAGKMGITLVALNGISAISMSWLSTKIHLFSGLISRKKFKYLDILFSNTMKNQLIASVLLIALFNLFIFGLNIFKIGIVNRFLSYQYIFLLSIVSFVNQLINLWATYLRCHKQDPFFIISIVGGGLSLISTLTFGYYFGVAGVVYGYFSLTVLIGLPWSYQLYKLKKLEWH